jgi:RNA-directed DNA polymerase
MNAYTKISKNRGALTKERKDDNIVELFGITKAKKIAEQIKKGTYKIEPVKKTWTFKPGKNKKRPINVPTQSNRIVQEALRKILEVIYEPTFAIQQKRTNNLCSNYGFGPNGSTWTAIEKIKKYAQRCNIIIEGDIVSAYNPVDHDILLAILRKRIKDKKFLNLIKQMFNVGIVDGNSYKYSLTRTSQGGSISPLLFNIYLLGFDDYVYNEFIKPILIENQNNKNKKLRVSHYYSEEYRLIRNQIKQIQEKLNAKTIFNKKNRTVEIKSLKRELKKLIIKRTTISSNDLRKLPKRALYVRYADDWIFAFTGTKKEAEKYKVKLTEFLKENRKMELNLEKTKITRASQGFKFLGFELVLKITKPKLIRVLQKTKQGTYLRVLQRTTSRKIRIQPDCTRVLQRLKANNFVNKKNMPVGKASWIKFDQFQIVEKFDQIFRKIFNYYKPCTKLRGLTHASYILLYSCAKTLARKEKISLSQILKKYSKSLKITRKILVKREYIIRSKFFHSYTLLSNILSQPQTF